MSTTTKTAPDAEHPATLGAAGMHRERHSQRAPWAGPDPRRLAPASRLSENRPRAVLPDDRAQRAESGAVGTRLGSLRRLRGTRSLSRRCRRSRRDYEDMGRGLQERKAPEPASTRVRGVVGAGRPVVDPGSPPSMVRRGHLG
jgi:hypothetical protein